MRMTELIKVPTKLTKGSRYKVMSKSDNSSPLTSQGEFLGYIQFGQDSGLLLRLDSQGEEGRMRIIPSSNVIYLDILETKEEEETKKKEAPLVSYG